MIRNLRRHDPSAH